MIEVSNLAETIKDGLRTGSIKTGDSSFECTGCFNTGFRKVDDPRKGPYTGVVRCNWCSYWSVLSQAYRGNTSTERGAYDERVN